MTYRYFKRIGCVVYSMESELKKYGYAPMEEKDVEQNILYVAHGYDPATAYRSDFKVHDFHFLTVNELPQHITFKIRHTPEWHRAEVERMDEKTYVIHSEAAIHGVAPGQFCVVYDENHHRCYGSGEITL